MEGLTFEFTGDIWHWRGPAPYHFITVPEDASAQLRDLSAALSYGWGVIPVRARIGDTEWTTSLFPRDDGYALPVKDAVRRAEQLAEGSVVSVIMEPTRSP
ncbi:hypothetical protein BKA15_000035 [Microlunatus parietis]|uniref:DUF1905 domain-containing protein n=1 Tax=Microlunatus parietis TaxID=682979 RepID=A0A7Y9I2C3_9ACTN|nr:DUF1905 domain-containing protein [Microlunatus parietis]NYE68706.1 hypothetical protein [Microlunatus parietis]